MNFFKIILFSIILSLFSSCELDNCFKKAGDIVQETIEYNSFSVMQINGIFNVELVQDTIYYIEKIAHSQIMSDVHLELLNDTLSCYNNNNCFWRHDLGRPLLRVHFSDIKQLNVMEASYIFSSDSITDSFWLTVRCDIAEADITFNNNNVWFYINKSCGGKYIFRGKTNNAFLMSFNMGLFEMSELECKKAQVQNHSIIDMKVNVLEELKVEIYNTGNIRYKGSPKIIYDSLISSGRAIPMN